MKALHWKVAKIGELTLENDFLEGALTKAGLLKRKAMIDREHDLPTLPAGRGARASAGAPSTINPEQPRPRICGSCATPRRTASRLPVCGQPDAARLPEPGGRLVLGRLAITSLMKRIGIAAIYRRPNTSSKPAPGQGKIYPYRTAARGEDRTGRSRWAMDITYIPMARGFVYLVAVVDWFSRRVLSHRVSITMETDFCIEALEEALASVASRTSSTAIRGASSPASTLPACC